jgi:hypothetical protein
MPDSILQQSHRGNGAPFRLVPRAGSWLHARAMPAAVPAERKARSIDAVGDRILSDDRHEAMGNASARSSHTRRGGRKGAGARDHRVPRTDGKGDCVHAGRSGPVEQIDGLTWSTAVNGGWREMFFLGTAVIKFWDRLRKPHVRSSSLSHPSGFCKRRNMTQHPSDADIKAFCFGGRGIPWDDVRAMEAHFSKCEHCAARVSDCVRQRPAR